MAAANKTLLVLSPGQAEAHQQLFLASSDDWDTDACKKELFVGLTVGVWSDSRLVVAWVGFESLEMTWGDVDPTNEWADGARIDADALTMVQRDIVHSSWSKAVEFVRGEAQELPGTEVVAGSVEAVQLAIAGRPTQKAMASRKRTRQDGDEADEDYENHSDLDSEEEMGAGATSTVGAQSTPALHAPVAQHANPRQLAPVHAQRKMVSSNRKLQSPPDPHDPSTYSYVACTPGVRSQATPTTDTAFTPGPITARGRQYGIKDAIQLFLYATINVGGYGRPHTWGEDAREREVQLLPWLAELADEAREEQLQRGVWKGQDWLRYASHPITARELEVYWGISLLMDTKDIGGSMKAYWSRADGVMQVRCSGMPRTRWAIIRLCLRGYSIRQRQEARDTSNTTSKEYRSATSLPLELAFNQMMPPLWEMSEFMAVDENMSVCTSSLCPYKVRMPLKPVKMGIKTFFVTDSRQRFTPRIAFYNGQLLWDRLKALRGFEHHTTSIAALLHYLAGPFMRPKGSTRDRVCVVDNWFTSAKILTSLSAVKAPGPVRILGTLRANSRPLAVKDAMEALKRDKKSTTRSTPCLGFFPITKTPRGQLWIDATTVPGCPAVFEPGISNRLSIFVLCDPQPFSLITNSSRYSAWHGSRDILTKQPDGSVQAMKGHEALRDYRKSYGGVDRMDAALGTYCRNTRCGKWPLRFYNLVMSLVFQNMVTWLDALPQAASSVQRSSRLSILKCLAMALIYGGDEPSATQETYSNRLEGVLMRDIEALQAGFRVRMQEARGGRAPSPRPASPLQQAMASPVLKRALQAALDPAMRTAVKHKKSPGPSKCKQPRWSNSFSVRGVGEKLFISITRGTGQDAVAPPQMRCGEQDCKKRSSSMCMTCEAVVCVACMAEHGCVK